MIIFRYLSKELYANVVAITLVLLIILITNQFMHYLSQVGQGLLTMTAVLEVMSLQIPLLLGYMLPFGLYLSVLLVLSRLYSENEMTVLSACGMSKARLYSMVMAIAVVVAIVVAILMLWLEPVIEQYRTRILQHAVATVSIEKVVPKRFQALPSGGVFYANEVNREQRSMQDVFFFLHDKASKNYPHGAYDVTVAKQANLTKLSNTSSRFLVFSIGFRYIGYPGQNNYHQAQFQTYGINLLPGAIAFNDWPYTSTMSELWHEVKTSNSAFDVHQANAVIQWRIAMPIAALIFALLAVPLSYAKPRQGRFVHLFPAVIIFIIYADLLFLGRTWIGNGELNASLGMWWIHGSILLIAIVLIIYQVGWRRILHLTQMRTS